MTVIEINEMVTEQEVAKNDSPEGQLVGSTAATNRQVAESFGDLSLKVLLRAATVALRGADRWPTTDPVAERNLSPGWNRLAVVKVSIMGHNDHF